MRFPIVYSLCLYNATGNAAGIKKSNYRNTGTGGKPVNCIGARKF